MAVWAAFRPSEWSLTLRDIGVEGLKSGGKPPFQTCKFLVLEWVN
jgi:hypothetical protein